MDGGRCHRLLPLVEGMVEAVPIGRCLLSIVVWCSWLWFATCLPRYTEGSTLCHLWRRQRPAGGQQFFNKEGRQQL